MNKFESLEAVNTHGYTNLTEEKSANNRNSHVELLKIFAIILIIIAHTVPTYRYAETIELEGFINLAIINDNFLVLCKYLGQIGNAIFVISSSYFLLNSNGVKIKKVFKIVLNSFFISIIILYLAISVFDIAIPIKNIVKQFFPIFFENNWFIGCYLLLYLIHPLLNKIISSTDKSELLKINYLIVIFYIIINSMFIGKLYYTKLIGFIAIYFLMAYQKKYLINFSKDMKMNRLIFLVSCLLAIVQVAIINVMGNDYSFFSSNKLLFLQFNNPISLLIGFSIFNIFMNKRQYCSKIINYISSVTLIIYLLHENWIFRYYIKPIIFQYIYNTFSYKHIVLIVILLSIITFAISLIIAILYKLVTAKLVDKLCDVAIKTYNKVYNLYSQIMLKLD